MRNLEKTYRLLLGKPRLNLGVNLQGNLDHNLGLTYKKANHNHSKYLYKIGVFWAFFEGVFLLKKTPLQGEKI